jgi:hypothetical protein
MSTSYEMNSDMATENSMLLAENNNLRQRVKALRETVDSQAARLAQFVADRDMQIIANSAGETTVNNVVRRWSAFLIASQQVAAGVFKLNGSDGCCCVVV